MLRARSIILIITGVFLEVMFYYFRFCQDGIFKPIAIIIGISLTVLLISISTFWKNPFAWLIIIPLVFYSVYCTSAGQTFSLSSRKLKNSLSQEEVNEIKEDIIKFKTKIKTKQDEIDIIPIEKKHWDFYDVRIKDDEKEIKEYEKKLELKQNELKNSRNKILPGENTYNHYNNITGIPATILQTIFSILLSCFIALLAPFGINIYPKKEVKKIVEDDVPRWIAVSTAGSKEYFVGKEMVLAFLEKQKTPMTVSRYDTILTAACLAKCVEIKEDKIYPLIDDIDAFEKRLRRYL